ncbi:MAG: SusC/RagA family TonB-linked outer membrane protein [Flavobacteriaceae bacterium]|nr:SusC/RagA family TonB-linked outer membrane protein [Flavobacteriaceae bacterium]
MEIGTTKPYGRAQRLFLYLMRTFIFLLCTTMFGLTTRTTFSQEKVTVATDRTLTVDEVFDLIKTQTKYRFIYPQDLFANAPKIDLKKGRVSVEQLLQQAVQKEAFNIILGRNDRIIIRPKQQALQRQITGAVTDTNGVPLQGVTVVLKGTTRGTLTDFEGNYAIQVLDSEQVLVFSYLGFTRQEITVGTQSTIHVKLEESVSALDEVVLNAGYYTVSERERTGSIEKVSAVDIEKQPISNPLAGLQGRAAGVEIVQTSGVTGSRFNIQIRGRNSIRPGANEPLYIVDGVPFSSSSLGEQQSSATVITGGAISPLNNLNPSDIESIEILKDADATAIYGSRGANGVVLITTKKGKVGKTMVELNIQTGFGKVSNTLDVLDTPSYLAMRREAYVNDGIDPLPSNAYDINGTWDENRYTNWQKVLFGKTSYLTNVQGSMSGGSQQTQFLISGNYHRQSNVYYGDYANDKISVLANLNHASKDDRFGLQFSTGYTANTNNLPATGLAATALGLPPNAPELLNDDGSLNWENSTWSNPLRHLEGLYESHSTNLISNMNLRYNLIDDLSLTTNLGYTESHVKELKTTPSTIYDPAYGVGSEYSSAIHNVSQRTSWIVEPQLHFGHDFGNTRLEVLAGLTFQEQKDDRLSQNGQGFTNNSLIKNLAAASNIIPIQDTDQVYRYHAMFGRININHQGKYILNATGRRDGSSRFGPNKRYANFGALGAVWVFSNEKFISQGVPFLSFGKLRASYGTSGNDQIGDYQYLDTYSYGSTQYLNTVGLYPTRLFNPDFGWESNKKFEIGLDLGFFKDRIVLDGSYYKNRSSNQLVGIPLPSTTGFGSIQGNLDATVENTGWELSLNMVNLNSQHLRWSTSFNLTIPRNKLVAFPDLEGSTYANQLVVGEPLNIVKLYQFNGVNPDTGLYEFEDFNGDGNISSPDDRQIIKDVGPRFYGGFANQLSYKKFQFDALFQFSKQEGYNYWYSSGIPGGMANQPLVVLQRWQSEGDQSLVQRFSSGRDSEARRTHSLYSNSDASVSDASYLRLKTLSISYEVAHRNSNGFGCELFLRGQNLWTWTNYKGLDPETQSTSSPPVLRMISVGTQLKF